MLVIGDIIRNNSTQFPDKIGLVHDGRRFTWKQTDARVNCFAQGLIKMGVQKQSSVGLLLRNCHQWVESALALSKLGLKMVPLNMRLNAGELTNIINDAQVHVIICDRDKSNLVRHMLPDLQGIESIIGCFGNHGFENDFEKMISDNQAKDPFWDVSPDDISVLIYTSGTTGAPKGAMLTHSNLMAGAVCQGYEYRMTPSSIAMTFIPLFFIGGWGATCLPYLIRGCTQHILTFEPGKVLRLLQDEKVNCTLMVPTMINILINHPDVGNYDYSSLMSIPFAGSPLPVEHWHKAIEIFGNIFISMYGFTEGCGTVSILQIEDMSPMEEEAACRRMASCGRAVVLTTIKLLGNDGRKIPYGSDEIGEICVKGPSIFKGYWNLPEATGEVMKDGWFHTGDLARQDKDGFYYIVDRIKDVIITGGINVYPREIEEVIHMHPLVLECAVIGVPDDRWGETIRAVISVKPGPDVTETEIIQLCLENLASFKKPTSVKIENNLPRTASGKILKRKLREEYISRDHQP